MTLSTRLTTVPTGDTFTTIIETLSGERQGRHPI